MTTFTTSLLSSKTQYRAFTFNDCSPRISSAISMDIDPIPIGGSIFGSATNCEGSITITTLELSQYFGTISGTSSIHYGTATDLVLNGYNGTILRWERKLGAGSWQTISNTLASLAEIPGSVGTWFYRALIASGTRPSGYMPEFTLTVTPNELVVNSATVIPKTYDGNKDATISGANLSGVFSGDDVTLVNSKTGTYAQSSIGKGIAVAIDPMKLTGKDAANYTLTQPAGLVGNITARTLTVTANDISKVYGADYRLVTANPGDFTVEGLVEGDVVKDVTLTSFGALPIASLSGSPWDIQPDKATGTGLNNYDILYKTGKLSIRKALLIIIADDKSKSYGAADPFLTYGYYGWTNGIESITTAPNVVTSTLINSPVGTYKEAINVSGGLAENYFFCYLPGNMTITKATLTIVADPKTKIYGSPDPPLTYTCYGWRNGENETVFITKPKIITVTSNTSNVGVYNSAISVSGASCTNYFIIYVPAPFTITPKTVTPLILADNKNYDNTRGATISNMSLIGVLPSDEVSLIANVAEFESAQPGKGKVVTATGLKLTGADSGNYLLSSITAFAFAEIYGPPEKSQVPGVIKNIQGTADVCAGSREICYAASPSDFATEYIWKLPEGATLVSGEGSPNVKVNFSNEAVSGILTVHGRNAVYDGPDASYTVNISKLPASSGDILGASSICQGTTGVTYLVTKIADVTAYNWSIPFGASIVSGTGTNTITVDYAMNATNGNIFVYGTNLCGRGPSSKDLVVTINIIPGVPVIAANVDNLLSNASRGNQWYFSPDANSTGTLVSDATEQVCEPTLIGWYWTITNLNGCTSVPSNHVYHLMSGGNKIYSLYPVPNNGQFTISITTEHQQLLDVSIYNPIGQKIFDIADLSVFGEYKIPIQLKTVDSGLYIVKFRNKDGQEVRRMSVYQY